MCSDRDAPVDDVDPVVLYLPIRGAHCDCLSGIVDTDQTFALTRNKNLSQSVHRNDVLENGDIGRITREDAGFIAADLTRFERDRALARLYEQPMREISVESQTLKRNAFVVVVEPETSRKVVHGSKADKRRIPQAEELLARCEVDEVHIEDRAVIVDVPSARGTPPIERRLTVVHAKVADAEAREAADAVVVRL